MNYRQIYRKLPNLKGFLARARRKSVSDRTIGTHAKRKNSKENLLIKEFEFFQPSIPLQPFIISENIPKPKIVVENAIT